MTKQSNQPNRSYQYEVSLSVNLNEKVTSIQQADDIAQEIKKAILDLDSSSPEGSVIKTIRTSLYSFGSTQTITVS